MVVKSQFEKRLEAWAQQHHVEHLIAKNDVFVHVDKYNKPIDKKHVITSGAIEELKKTDQENLEKLKKSLPYEDLYFGVTYNATNDIFLIRRKTPIQSMLNVWAVVLIIWALYRWYFKTSMPIWVDEFIAKPVVFFIPVYYYITKIEKQNFFKGVDLDWKKMSVSQVVIAALLGGVFFIAGGVSYFLKHTTLSPHVISAGLPAPLLLLIFVAFATAISEEMLSRGFVLKRLYNDLGNVYTSAFLSSILFFFMHIPILFTNEAFFGQLLLQVMLTDFLLSMAVSFMYLQTRNLLVPILIHALYNLSLYIFSSNKI
jgi:membrane protease YdiL (CAAX protease family)